MFSVKASGFEVVFCEAVLLKGVLFKAAVLKVACCQAAASVKLPVRRFCSEALSWQAAV